MENKEPHREYSENDRRDSGEAVAGYGNSPDGHASSDDFKDNDTTGSGFSKQERDRQDGTNGDELDPDYYDDKENPGRKSGNSSVDYNRSDTPDAAEGTAPNR
ncbi:MAG TPA: hypothetical protein VFR70_02010 [Flavobacterium sp.]|nr:hypothetical protein [Flavobacterium sp.]